MSDFSLSRSMLIAMLSSSQMECLHVKECSLGRCLFPLEAANLLGLDSLKEYWSIPDEDRNLAKHGIRVRHELIRAGCYADLDGPVEVIHVDNVHIFDQNVMVATKKSSVNFGYQGGSRSSKKITQELTT